MGGFQNFVPSRDIQNINITYPSQESSHIRSFAKASSIEQSSW